MPKYPVLTHFDNEYSWMEEFSENMKMSYVSYKIDRIADLQPSCHQSGNPFNGFLTF